MNAKLRTVFVSMACMVCLLSSYAQTPLRAAPLTDAQVFMVLQDRIDKNAARGVAIALIDPGGSVRFLSKGQSGNPIRPQIDEDTLFEIGSITKVFTATILAQRVEEGAFALDKRLDEVTGYGYRWTNPGVGAVTLRQLATHSSGLPRIPHDLNFLLSGLRSPRNPYANYSSADMWSYVTQLPLEPKIDRPVVYSNLGPGLLGDVLAISEKSSYSEMIAARIFAPLGMTASGIGLVARRLPFMAQGHNAALIAVPRWELASMQGAGGLLSSAKDMARFLQSHIQNTLAGARATHSTQVRIDSSKAVALGWFIDQRYGEEIHWHNGATGGFSSFVGFNLGSGKGVVVLSNVSQGVDDIGFHLLSEKFPINANPRRSDWTGLLTSLILCMSVLLQALVTPVVTLGRSTAADIHSRILTWRQKAVLRSKSELIWTLADMSVISVFAHHFVYWEWIGVGGRHAFFVVIGILVLALIWQSRTLPWQGPPRILNRFFRIIRRAFSVLLLAIALWSLV